MNIIKRLLPTAIALMFAGQAIAQDDDEETRVVREKRVWVQEVDERNAEVDRRLVDAEQRMAEAARQIARADQRTLAAVAGHAAAHRNR